MEQHEHPQELLYRLQSPAKSVACCDVNALTHSLARSHSIL